MAKPTVKGSLQPQKQSVTIKYDPSNGTTTTTHYVCAPGGDLQGVANTFAAQGASYELTYGQKSHSLVVTQTTHAFQEDGEDVVDRWELFSNQLQIDIKNHPTWGTIAIATRAQILKDVDRHKAGKATVNDWGTPGDLSNADHFFQHMIRGKTHYLKPQWVLRVTSNVPNTYQNFVEANGGVATIYTPAQVVSALPAGRLKSTVASITAPPGNSYLTYGWLKVSYTEVTAARNRVDVSNELWLDEYPTILYS